jgi:retron-type reverse transcriptase
VRSIKLISSFLSKRALFVSMEGEISTPRIMQAGVPQGPVVSPSLFNIYVNDALKYLGSFSSFLLMILVPVSMRQNARRAMS